MKTLGLLFRSIKNFKMVAGEGSYMALCDRRDPMTVKPTLRVYENKIWIELTFWKLEWYFLNNQVMLKSSSLEEIPWDSVSVGEDVQHNTIGKDHWGKN